MSEPTHLCPRCGIRCETKGRGGRNGLCRDCRWSDTNTAYVWTAARAEVRRLLRSGCECGAGTWETCSTCQWASAQRYRRPA